MILIFRWAYHPNLSLLLILLLLLPILLSIMAAIFIIIIITIMILIFRWAYHPNLSLLLILLLFPILLSIMAAISSGSPKIHISCIYLLCFKWLPRRGINILIFYNQNSFINRSSKNLIWC